MIALRNFARLIVSALRDLAPIIFVVAFFQIVVLQQPFPNLGGLLIGLALVILGLALFVQGLESGLFPLGEAMANAFASKGSLTVLLSFAFGLGFGTTVAEPALIAVAEEAAEIAAAAGQIAADPAARERYADGLRYTVALSVGVALIIGVVRIIKGWPVHVIIIAGYIVVIAQTARADKRIIPLAYDSGGVTTSTVTVPVVAALGLGLASSIPGRSPLIDGFGLIAFASLFPMMSVMAYATLTAWWRRRREEAAQQAAEQAESARSGP